MLRRHKWLIIVGAIVVVLVAIRLALPSVVRDYVNDKLMALEAYDGHVDDIDLALWRGAYRIDGIRIVKTGAEQPVPFFSSDRIDLSVEWGSLMRRTSLFATIASVVRNAFVSAFARSLEGSISVRSVRRKLEDVGEPDDDH